MDIDQFKNELKAAQNIVFFGGAGVSTESGIPDFRSVDGLYNQKYDYPPEHMLSHTFFMKHTEEFYRFHKDKMIYLDAKPNKAHIKLAELEQQGKLKAVITQNIDGLHQMAGSKSVLELHGCVHRNYCMDCAKKYEIKVIINSEGVPYCDCGGIIRPDVVLYEEGLDNEIMESAVKFISAADMLIVGGTSLNVYPAAGLINYFRGKCLVLINKSSTPFDNKADIVINEKLGEVLEQV